MKSKEFITEYAEDEWDNIKKLIIQIGKECKPYLSQVNDPFELYRGISFSDTIIKKRIRIDERNPLGMDQKMQGMVNKFFTEKFGAPFRFSALATGEQWVADSFGNVYIIFPIGDFEFLWANDVGDLNEHIWAFEESFGDNIEYNDIAQFLNDKDYRTNDINSAIASGREIMIRGSGYYGINLDDMYGQDKNEIEALLQQGMNL